MPKTGGYYQSILPGNLHLFASQSPERISDIPREKISSQDSAQQFSSACFCCLSCLFSIYCQALFSCHLHTHSTALVYHVALPTLIILWASFQVAWGKKKFKKKSQYEFMKQCMNKSFPPLNTPLSKWSRDFSRTIYITVADTGFKFSCQSQDGILNHPIFLNEVREF